MPRQCADDETLALHRNAAQLPDIADIDDQFWLNQAQVHRGNQALPARKHPRLLTMLDKQFQRIGNAGCACVGESRSLHSGEPSPDPAFLLLRD